MFMCGGVPFSIPRSRCAPCVVCICSAAPAHTCKHDTRVHSSRRPRSQRAAPRQSSEFRRRVERRHSTSRLVTASRHSTQMWCLRSNGDLWQPSGDLLPLSVNSPDLHTDIILYYQRSACALVLLCSAFVFFL